MRNVFRKIFLFREIESIPVKGGSCYIGNCSPKDIRNPCRVFQKKMEVLENGYIARFFRDIKLIPMKWGEILIKFCSNVLATTVVFYRWSQTKCKVIFDHCF